MMRFNLQLFGLNTKTSVVDYLKSQGEDSSMTARKELAKSLGIQNYSGTEEQNIQMLSALQNGSAPNTGSVKGSLGNGGGSQKVTLTDNVPASGGGAKPPSGGGAKPPSGGGASIKGVDQGITDKMTSSFNLSGDASGARAESDAYLQKVKDMAGVTDIIDQSTWDALNTSFQMPSAITEAFSYTNQLLQQLSSGRTSYTDQIKALMSDIQNRDKFSYDVDTDPMFQQALASAMGSGKTAMQDTIGQASALTGGYGSTYATTAGNQAYNAYIQDAYANLPEYYQMALEAYQMEGQEMYQQFAMLSEADATEYQRMYDAWNANFSSAQQMYQNAYGEWQDGINNAYNSASLQLQEHGQLFDQLYSAYTATANNAQQMYQNEYNAWADEIANAMNYAGMANADYWNNAEFSESFNQDMAKGSGSSLKYPDQKYFSGAIEAFATGGEDGLAQYIDTLPPDIDVDVLIDHVAQYGVLPESDRNWTLDKETATAVDDYGNVVNLEDLPEEIRAKVEASGKYGHKGGYTSGKHRK